MDDSVGNFDTAASQFKELLGELLTLRQSSSGDEWKEASAPLVSKCAQTFLQLKSASRKTCLNGEECRKEVAAAKANVDLAQLHLQNMTYERNHLARAIQLCQDFSTKQLDKIEDDEQEPILKDIDQPMTTEDHQENLATLSKELQVRQRMEEDLASVQMKVKAMESALAARKQFLEGLPGVLTHMEKAAAPLAKYMSASEARERSTLAAGHGLPRPLHVLLLQLHGYATFFASHKLCEQDDLTVSVVPASEYRPESSSMEPPASASASSAISPSTASRKRASKDDDDEGSIKKARRGASRSSSRARETPSKGGTPSTSQKKETLSSPSSRSLSKTKRTERSATKKATISDEPEEKAVLLTVKVYVKESAEVVEFNISFHFLPDLQAVTVVVENNPDLLATLIPQDTGEGCPTALVRQLVLAGAKLPGYGRMYRWAQRLAGLLEATAPDGEEVPHLETSTRGIMERLRNRIRAWSVLNLQLQKLQGKPHPIPVHPSCKHLFATTTKAGAKLQGWQELTKPEMDAFPPTDFAPPSMKGSALKRPDWQRYGCRFFSASFSRQRGDKKVHLSVLCEISPEYPVRAPRFLLQSRAEPPAGAAVRPYDNHLKAIESEVNAFYDELISKDTESLDWVLSHQLRKLQACFDTLGDSNGNLSNSQQPGYEMRVQKGRDRRKTLVFNNKVGRYMCR